MSSETQSIVAYLRLNNTATIIVVTAVVYDYLIDLSREIEYIWTKPWSGVSTLFVLARYFGLSYAVTYGFLNNAFSPGTVVVSSTAIQISQWTFEMFFAAVDMVMILRVYAMWRQSKTILGLLLFIYVPQVITAFVFSGLLVCSYINVSTIQVLDTSICLFSYNLPSPIWLYMIPHYVLNAALLVLSVTEALRQSFNMYKATKTWQPNRYIQLFVREGIIYVFVRVLVDIVNVVSATVSPSFNIPMLFVSSLVTIPLLSMMPRFIVGMREMYDHDRNPRGQDTDSFGVSPRIIRTGNMVMSAIAFADTIAPGESLIEDADDLEMIRLDSAKDSVDVQASGWKPA